MDAERWQRVKAILDDALGVAPDARAAFVDVACDGDDALRDEVASLLAADDDVSEFLERPAFVAAADALLGARDARERLPDGTRVGAFRIVRELGRGGMGTVYLAERDDGEYQRVVALKVISRGMDTELVVRRFRQERQILAQLSHPNVARLLTGGTTDDGRPYFAMEYVEGVPVDRYCVQQSMTIAERLQLFRSVCAAVQYAHQHLVVHRDIKPANVLVTADGTPKLLDFGIAKVLADDVSRAHATAATMHAMTPAYASPEQLAGEPVTTLTDVYSLGVLLYEILTGRHPHAGAADDGTHEPERPSLAVPEQARALHGDVDNIVSMAMRREPSRRYTSAAQLSEDVRRHLAGLPVIARPDTLRYRVTKFVRRNTVGVIAAGIVALSLVGGILGTTWQARRARTQQALAEQRFAEVRQLATSFLFDLDESIRELPGSTNARELLVGRALSSLDGLAREAQDDRSLLRDLAVAYVRVGDVQGKPYAPNLGHTEGALASYRKAIAILEPLAQHAPADVRLRRDLAGAYQATSAVQARAGDVDGAITMQRKATTSFEALLAADPKSVELRERVSENLIWLGRTIYQRYTVPAAEEALGIFGRARAIREQLALEAPHDVSARYRAGVAGAYEGYARWQLGDYTGDTAQYRAALGRLAISHVANQAIGRAMPENVDMRRASVDALHEMAVLHVKLGEGDSALAKLRAARPTTTALAAADSRNAEAQRDLAVLEQTTALAYASVGDRRAARLAAGRARAVLDRLRASDTSSTDDLRALAEIATTLGDVARADGDLRSADAEFHQARDYAARWLTASPRADAARRMLAERLSALADIEDAERRRGDACDLRRRALPLWHELATRVAAAPLDVTHAHDAERMTSGCDDTGTTRVARVMASP